MGITLETLKEVIKIHGSVCVLTGSPHINFHHNHQWQGRSNQNPYFIIPIAKDIHDILHGWADSDIRQMLQDKLDYYMLSKAPDSVLKEFSKVDDLIAKRERLRENISQGNYEE